MTTDEPGEIGSRARRIRRRRGLSLDAVAGLSGISKGYLSRLENGERNFTRRGLIENLAAALGCSPADLTGSPVVASDERAAAAESAIPAVSASLHDSTLDDVPDVAPRELATLVELADRANSDADNVRYDGVADAVLGDLITELHVLAAIGPADDRRRALEALVVACLSEPPRLSWRL